MAAPANTAIQASRAGADAGFVLATSETMNNGVLLVVMPVVALLTSQGEAVAVTGLLGAVVAFGGAISLMDLAAIRRRELAQLAHEADVV